MAGEREWLPPQAPGGPPAGPPPPPGRESPEGSEPPAGPPPPPGRESPEGSEPPAGQPYPPPPQPYPPPGAAQSGYGPPPAYGPPPGYGQYGPPPWWPPGPQEPGNGPAIAGFVLSLSALGLLFFTVGFGAPIALVCAILGIVYGQRGKRKVDRGETRQHRGFAQAGFVIGIVATILALLAIAGLVALFASDPEWFEEELNDDRDFEISALLRVATTVLSSLS